MNHRLLAATLLAALTPLAQAQSKLKVGLMLPATGTFAALGTAIENGFRLYVAEQGGKLSGRDIEFVSRPEPAGGTERRCPDIGKLTRLGYAPQVPLAKGLPPTVDWYFANDDLAPKT